MSTYSQAWNDTPPAVRDFYRNFARLRGAMRYPDFDLWIFWQPRSGAPYNAYVNWTNQLADVGSFNPAIVSFLEYSPGWRPDPTLPWDITEFYAYTDDLWLVPRRALDYPRPKGNVRKSYWTGKPRHRQNI